MRASILALLLLLPACGDDGSPSTLEDMEIAYLKRPAPGLVTAGQLTREQFAGLPDVGVTRVICLRPATEKDTGWEEAAAPDGIAYVRLPIPDRAALNRANVEALAKLLGEPTGGDTLVYCGSSNRVGTLFGLKAHWLDGKTPQEAVEIGKAAGMTKLEPVLRKLLGL